MIIAFSGNAYHKLFLESYLATHASWSSSPVQYVSLVGPRLAVFKRLVCSAWHSRKFRAKVFIPLSGAFIYQLAFLMTGCNATLYSDGIADLLDCPPALYRVLMRLNFAIKTAPITSLDQYLYLVASFQFDSTSNPMFAEPNKAFVLINLKAPVSLGKQDRIKVLIDSLNLAKAYADKHGLLLIVSPHKSVHSCISREHIANICSPMPFLFSYHPVYPFLVSKLCCAFITQASGAAADALALRGSYPIFLLDLGSDKLSRYCRMRNAAYLNILMSSGDRRLQLNPD